MICMILWGIPYPTPREWLQMKVTPVPVSQRGHHITWLPAFCDLCHQMLTTTNSGLLATVTASKTYSLISFINIFMLKIMKNGMGIIIQKVVLTVHKQRLQSVKQTTITLLSETLNWICSLNSLCNFVRHICSAVCITVFWPFRHHVSCYSLFLFFPYLSLFCFFFSFPCLFFSWQLLPLTSYISNGWAV